MSLDNVELLAWLGKMRLALLSPDGLCKKSAGFSDIKVREKLACSLTKCRLNLGPGPGLVIILTSSINSGNRDCRSLLGFFFSFQFQLRRHLIFLLEEIEEEGGDDDELLRKIVAAKHVVNVVEVVVDAVDVVVDVVEVAVNEVNVQAAHVLEVAVLIVDVVVTAADGVAVTVAVFVVVIAA